MLKAIIPTVLMFLYVLYHRLPILQSGNYKYTIEDNEKLEPLYIDHNTISHMTKHKTVISTVILLYR